MKYKALFLDLDGTLFETLKDIQVSVNFALNKHGFKTRTLEEVQTYLGHGSYYMISKAIGEEVEEELFTKIFKTYKAFYNDHPVDFTIPYPGVIETLEIARKNEIKIIMITNKPEDIAIKIANKLCPHLFDGLYCQVAGRKVKPDPESYEPALKDFNLKPSEVLYIGDSLVDQNLANNAGFDYKIANYGYETKENLHLFGDHLIDKFSDILALII